jgi:hypothetical protein
MAFAFAHEKKIIVTLPQFAAEHHQSIRNTMRIPENEALLTSFIIVIIRLAKNPAQIYVHIHGYLRTMVTCTCHRVPFLSFREKGGFQASDWLAAANSPLTHGKFQEGEIGHALLHSETHTRTRKLWRLRSRNSMS